MLWEFAPTRFGWRLQRHRFVDKHNWIYYWTSMIQWGPRFILPWEKNQCWAYLGYQGGLELNQLPLQPQLTFPLPHYEKQKRIFSTRLTVFRDRTQTNFTNLHSFGPTFQNRSKTLTDPPKGNTIFMHCLDSCYQNWTKTNETNQSN